MSLLTPGLGKELYEPVPPYRVARVFGAELGKVDANNWNTIPTVRESFGLLDLSELSPNHEVCVCLIGILGALPATYQIQFKWYRFGDISPFFQWNANITAQYNWWYYSYCYVGYTPWEINKNGSYRVEISVSGAETLQQTIEFAITGLPSPLRPPPVMPESVNIIVKILNNIADFFYDVYIEVHGWIWPFRNADSIFYAISEAFSAFAFAFVDFSEWVSTVTEAIANIISWDNITQLFSEWFDKITEAWTWVVNAGNNILTKVESWWSSASTTVQGWIDTATQGLSDLIAEWNKFWNVTLPNLLSKIDLETWWNSQLYRINQLITSAIKIAFPFYDDLVRIWEEIASFMTKPLDWLEKKFTDWFLGGE